MNYVLRTSGLTKKYKNQKAVDGLNMTICKGDIYGFVGENGSGKTTIIRLISGLISPYSGGFELFGIDNNNKAIDKARKRMGAIVETPSIYLNMSAYDNLMLQCNLKGINDNTKIPEALSEVGLLDIMNQKKKASNFSLGMRQRLGIAMALLGDPEFLILDEPMNGLDPAGIVEIRELILKLNREKGITFLISSHILSELSLVATKYGIISKGKLIKEISANELREECTKYTIIKSNQSEKLEKVVSDICKTGVYIIPNGIKIVGDINLNSILSAIIKADVEITSINCNETNIEDYYLTTIGGVHNA